MSEGEGITLRQAQGMVDRWISRFEEGYWPPLVNLARLTEEVGELARELNHRYGSKPKKEGEAEGDVALEIGDILFVLIALANEQGIDLTEAFGRVMEKYEGRDHDRWTPTNEERSGLYRTGALGSDQGSRPYRDQKAPIPDMSMKRRSDNGIGRANLVL